MQKTVVAVGQERQSVSRETVESVLIERRFIIKPRPLRRYATTGSLNPQENGAQPENQTRIIHVPVGTSDVCGR